MNQPPQWGPPSQWGPYGQPPMRPPQRSGPPTIVIVLLVLFGLPALAVVGCVVCVAAHGDSAKSDETKTDDKAVCLAAKKSMADILSTKTETTRSAVVDLQRRSTDGASACERAGMIGERNELRAFVKALDDELAKNPTATATAATALDPASCPKGRVRIDANTGKMVTCTGGSGDSANGESWLATLGKITSDPKGAKPRKITPDSTDNSINYDYGALGPFSAVSLEVYDAVPARWMLGMKTTFLGVGGLSPKGTVTRLCRHGIATWYQIDDGPLADSFASVGDRDTDGVIDVAVWSRPHMRAEMAKDEARGAPHAASVRDRLCAD